ncbi:MAG: hypothetical protein RL199_1485, partial [Pseudomonadota bacterium]
DCGGPCLKCKPTQDCGADTDCDSGRCDLTKKICADPTDLDKMRNGTETDIDCGGKASKRCALRKGCLVSGDCIDGAVCSAGFCAPATCANGVKDVTDPAVTNRETDLDCGGRVCGPCVSGRACAANTDCRSGVCTQQKVCAAPSATDNLQNGDETAKNCGGASGVGCAYGLPCRVDGDCALDMVCTAGICGYGECANSTKTGAARSCGRMCASHCDDGGACRASVDCKAGAVCLAGADERKTCTTRNCTLNGVDYRPGALNPENGCQACDPETNTWRPRGVGDACDDGKAGTTDDHCEVRYQTLVCVGTSFTCAAPATATCMAANVPVADGAPCDEDTDCADPVAVGQKLCVGGRCTGASCRAAPKPAGTVCGAVSGPCFSGGVCDGASLDCPVGDWLTGIECRAPAGPCDAPELCLNGLAACPSDRPRPVGDTCGTEKGDGFCVVSSGALQCLPCGVGQAFDAANGDCAACPAGQTSEGGASPCAAVNCAAGQYWNGTACALCAVGTSTAGGTVFACTSCTVTEKWNGVTRLCEPCPAGQRSNGGPSTGCTAITCAKDNYWTGTQCAPCPTGGRSTGGAVTGCTFTDVTAPVDATTGLVVTGGVGTLSLDWTTAQATDDVGVVKYRVAVSADASAPANCAAGTDVVGTRWTTPATLVGGRTYGLRLCALDAKGNVSRGLTGSGTPNDLCPKANNGGCSIHATCANVAGGRTCTCPATSVTTDMGRSCIPPPLVSPPTDRTIGGAMFTFVTLPPGVFRMGSVTGAGADGYDPEAGGREAPAHVVTLTKPTIMARTETTQVQWTALMKVNAAWFRTASDAASRPVESVSWNDAVAFCNALSTADGLPAAYVGHARVAGSTGYRLPTEAEWEYAARATTTTPRHEQLDEAAWHAGNSVFAGVAQTHAVGGKVRNAFELFDMLGNVAEWTGDWYAPYGLDAQTDPAGPATGKARVYRGGSWGFVGGEARAAFRGNVFQPSQRSYLVGFRVARTPSP